MEIKKRIVESASGTKAKSVGSNGRTEGVKLVGESRVPMRWTCDCERATKMVGRNGEGMRHGERIGGSTRDLQEADEMTAKVTAVVGCVVQGMDRGSSGS